MNFTASAGKGRKGSLSPVSVYLSWRAKAGHRLECTPIVTVLVGPFEHKFYFHHGLLCRHSLFFRQMLQSPHYTEAKENVVRLPEEDVERFAVFTKYVYVREYAGDKCDMGTILGGEPYFEDKETNYEADLDFSQFVQMNPEQGLGDMSSAPQINDHCGFGFLFSCYVFADMLQAPMYKRLVTDEILGHGIYCDAANLTTEHIHYAYDNTIRKDDPLRRFCMITKFEQSSMEDKVADSELFTMIENGGPLARDIMQACRKQAVNQKQEIIQSHKRDTKAYNDKIRGLEDWINTEAGYNRLMMLPAPYYHPTPHPYFQPIAIYGPGQSVYAGATYQPPAITSYGGVMGTLSRNYRPQGTVYPYGFLPGGVPFSG